MTVRMVRYIIKASKFTDVPVKGVVFDMDGTLCEAQTWMFHAMRDALSIPDSIDIIEYIRELPTPDERTAAHDKIMAIERKAMEEMVPREGLRQVMEFLDSRGIPKTICTRNTPGPVASFLERFLPGLKFHPVITREFYPPKPRPEPLMKIADEWGVDVKSLVMVGDSLDDMRAGHSAGAATVLIKTDANAAVSDRPETGAVIESLAELIGMLEEGFEPKNVQGDE